MNDLSKYFATNLQFLRKKNGFTQKIYIYYLKVLKYCY